MPYFDHNYCDSKFDGDLNLPFNLTIAEARGRTYAAARMLAGLDQAALAVVAKVSAGTVSNVERGREGRPETLRAIRNALTQRGVLVAFSSNNGLASVTISFAANEEEDD